MHPSIILAATLLLGQSASAAEAIDNPITSKSPELDALSFFEGFWHCEEQASFGDADKSVLVVKKELENSWYTFKWDAGSSTTSSFTHGHAYTSWDPMLNKYVEFSFSINGGYGATMADGFTDNQLIWNGGVNNYNGQSVFLRKVYKKTADNSFTLSISVSEDGNTYGTPTVKSCTKGK
ncbi:MAG: hypothetical protein EOO40_09470 [Deltaproteobacteria bacterium]|nr:MAG: hypothetical protein EOO40_09470 [Deltaproteobacteria bacterium]